MSSIRLRRLQADYQKLRRYVKRHPRLRLIQAEGDPPERYQLEYRVRSLRQMDEQMTVVKDHIVEVALPRNYPRTPPQCRMLTPIFHPNIAPHAICVGDHWSAGEPLWSLVARIGEMIAYQSYNTKSPLNGEAARWVDANQDSLPLDPVSMLVDEPERTPTTGTRASTRESGQTAVSESAASKIVQCPNCEAKLRLPTGADAKRVRCVRCKTIIDVPGWIDP